MSGLFHGLQTPSPPEALRERVLLLARTAQRPGKPPLTDRIWESRRAQLAAAILFAAILTLSFKLRSENLMKNPSGSSRAKAAAVLVDGLRVPDTRRSAAEQWMELAPELGLEEGVRRPTGGHE